MQENLIVIIHTLDDTTRFLLPQGQITVSHSCSKSEGFSTSHSEYIILKKEGLVTVTEKLPSYEIELNSSCRR